MYSSFVSLGKFIPRYLILFVAMVNRIDSFISLSEFSLLVYRNASDFCVLTLYPAAAATKSLQSCLILCDPIDSSPPGSSVPGILQVGTLEWVAISLDKFIPRYLVLFVAMVNGIASLISLSDFLLLVYRNESDFCIDFVSRIFAKFTD